MGGYGSGRQSKTNLTDDFLAIDVRQWQREKLLIAGNSFNTSWSIGGETIGNMGVTIQAGHLQLNYNCKQHGGDWEPLNYPVTLQTTFCNYGGVRYWFTCPATGCGKRVAMLYLGDKYFACRRCYRLAYKSQRETQSGRAIRRADKIRKKLHWQPGIAYPPSNKPKGMHWKTYLQLLDGHVECSKQVWGEMVERLKILDNRLTNLSD